MSDHPLMLRDVTLACDVLDRGRHFAAGSMGVIVDVLDQAVTLDFGDDWVTVGVDLVVVQA